MPIPVTHRVRNMLRHMRTKRRKTVASMPIKGKSISSLVRHNVVIHDQGAFPIGGGTCFSSACFSFGA